MLNPPKAFQKNRVLDWAQKTENYIKSITPRSSGTVKVKTTPGGTTFSVKPQVNDYPFLVYTAEEELRCTVGTWARNGERCSLVATAGDYTRVISSPGAASTAYVVYLELTSSANNDPRILPDGLSVNIDTSFPSDSSPKTGNRYLLLASVTSNDAGDGWLQPYQRYTGGDIDDTAYVPDSDSAGGRPYSSIELSPRAGDADEEFAKRTLQLKDWDSHLDTPMLKTDELLFQRPSDATKTLKYGTLDEALNSGDWGDAIADWLNGGGGSPAIEHNALDSTTGIGGGDFADGGGQSNDDHDKRYFRYAGTSENKNFDTVGWIKAGFGQSIFANLADSGKAGEFGDGLIACDIVDGTHAVYATDGNIRVAGTGVFQHLANDGITATVQVLQDGITKDMKISGGIIYEIS